MAATSYSPGTWFGIVRSRTAVFLGPDTQPALVAALWDLLEGRPEVHEVLHAVTSSSGASLANMPSFGILDFAGPLRVFLRGDLDVTVQSSDGAVELNGRDVTTWTERRLNKAGRCRLAISAAAGFISNHGQPEMPIGEGVVLLQSLVLSPDSASPLRGTQAPHQQEIPSAPEPAVQAEAAFLPEVTVAPEHGASAETVYAVVDEDFDEDSAVDGGLLETPDPLAGDPEADGQSAAGGGPGSAPAAGASDPVASGAAGPAGLPEEVPAHELTSSYDHLWERTVVRRIEDAAVREESEEPESAGPAAGGREAKDQEAAGHAAEAASHAEPVGRGEPPAAAALEDGKETPETADVTPAVVLDTPSAVSPLPAPARPETGGLIDSVPWRTADAGSGPVPPPAVLPPMLPAVPSAPLDAPVTPGPETGQADYDADHDGQTVIKSSLQGPAAQSAPSEKDVSAGGPLVLARLCPRDHANPPTSAACASCGAGLLPDAVQVARPRLGRMRISTGELVELDESLVIGRQPSVSRVQGGVMPRLVQVASPGGDISRSHVEVRLEGWHVMLCDLKATNGTVLVREGQPPRRLAQNEMAILLDGDIAELGDNISLRFEEIP
ncbi:FHA domain-containing protein [Pseudarthrobacter sp. NPDC058329]|uniref:FHA domain-containing protein n=1 Tax=Pseudarthrobacter sp. NPDC058329 TaxID=3346448 RepID=UPI0036DD5F7A